MNKKMIITFVATALLSFVIAFGASFLFSPDSEVQAVEANDANVEQLAASSDSITPFNPTLPQSDRPSGAADRKLKELAYDLREKKNQYQEKLKSLKSEQQKLQQLRQGIENDIEKLELLRVDLAESVNKIKTEREKLLKTRIEIDELEKNNLISISASYDKMDSASAGKILTNMTQGQNGSVNDAVKILYYMGDRNKAKVLASLADSEPSLAAYFSQKLKTLTEVQ